ncbi:MAG TPA: polysaccharide deacetylase family protein, partial [Candidatus Saccharimonadales bacterium]|nr:polysaccharide deacetylase family protein [Candidatus Saccharimonadales bacterium]
FQNVFAETSASDSAITPTLPLLPTLFPTITPSPTTTVSFSVLQQLILSQSSVASTSSVATVSATVTTSDDSTQSATTATLSPTPDIVASGSAQDFCLNTPVIMYHHIEPLSIATQLGHEPLTEDSTIFEEHIKYLSEHQYHFMALEDLVHAILNHKTLPPKSIVITIDDGYIDDYTYGFLMAKKYHAIMNFMIPTGLIGQPDYMTWDHLKEMTASPYARIYNHTTTHAALGLIDQSQIIQEVTTANQDLKKNLGIKNDIVIYPYGSYNDLAIQTLQQLGMIAAVTTDPGTNECVSDIMKLPRLRVGNEPIEDYGY